MSDPYTITQSGWRVETFEDKPAVARHHDGSRVATTELLAELGEAAAQKKRWEEIESALKKCLLDYAMGAGFVFIAPAVSNWTATIITQNRKQQDLDAIQNQLRKVAATALDPPTFLLLLIDEAKGWKTDKFPWMAEEPYSIPQVVRYPRLDRKPVLAPGKAPKEKAE